MLILLISGIWVTILSYASDSLKKEGWEVFLQDMKLLETEGLEIIVHGRPFRFYAVLVLRLEMT